MLAVSDVRWQFAIILPSSVTHTHTHTHIFIDTLFECQCGLRRQVDFVGNIDLRPCEDMIEAQHTYYVETRSPEKLFDHTLPILYSGSNVCKA